MSDGMEMQQGDLQPMAQRPTQLRLARESRGLHIAALAAALKVPVRKLEALEEGAYDELPDLMFARALASSACRHLKVDPAPVLAEMPVSTLPKLGDSPQTINAPYKDPEDAPSFTLGALFTRPVTIGVAVILVVTAALLLTPGLEEVNWVDWIKAQVGSPRESMAVAPVEESASGTVSEPVAPALQAAPQMVAPVSEGAGIDSTAPIDPLSTSAGIAAAAADPASSASVAATTDGVTAGPTDPATVASDGVSAAGGILQIRATGETWVEVVNGGGEVVVNRVLAGGETLSFSTSPPYSVVIGNSSAAEVNVRGQPFDTTPYARNRVARFQVK